MSVTTIFPASRRKRWSSRLTSEFIGERRVSRGIRSRARRSKPRTSFESAALHGAIVFKDRATLRQFCRLLQIAGRDDQVAAHFFFSFSIRSVLTVWPFVPDSTLPSEW